MIRFNAFIGFSEPSVSRLRKLFEEQNGQISAKTKNDNTNTKNESRSTSPSSSISSLTFPSITNGDTIPNGETFEAYESLGIASDEPEGENK